MPPLAALLSIFPFISTTLGGLAALRLRHRLHPIMGFASGVVVATALADLLPEAWDLVGADRTLLVGAAAVGGYLVFSAVEALVHRESWEHQHPRHADPHDPHEHPEYLSGSETRSMVGLLGPLGLIIHSTLDGLAIGLGFQASTDVGLLVALAVVAHDFADGINVVTLALVGGRGVRTAIVVLGLDALAPVAGFVLGSFVPISDVVLGVLLASFAGVFIAIGSGHLMPEAQHSRPGDAPVLVLLAAVGAVVALTVRAMAG